MNELKQWFLDQNPRDQVVLSVGGIAVLIYILLFLVLFPMQEELAKTQKRNQAALGEQQRVFELAGQVLGKREAGEGGGTQNLNGILNQSLREFGLRMEQFQPSGGAARVRLATSEFNKVLAWLHELEIKQGIMVKDLTVTADNNPGAVSVHLQLVQGE